MNRVTFQINVHNDRVIKVASKKEASTRAAAAAAVVDSIKVDSTKAAAVVVSIKVDSIKVAEASINSTNQAPVILATK